MCNQATFKNGENKMTKRSLLALSAMQTMAGKAIRDIRQGGRRETRNVLELCRSCANRPQQQEFWNMIKLFLTSPKKKYQELLHRTAASVQENILKTLAINLGCTSFSYGGDILRAEYQNGNEICWLQELTPGEDPQQTIRFWNEKGVSVFWLNTAAYSKTPLFLSELAAANSRCIFLYILDESCTDFSWLAKAAENANVCFLLSPSLLDRFAPWMHKNQLLFGVTRSYADVRDFQQEQTLLETSIRAGCLAAVYFSDSHPDADTAAQEEELYRLLKKVRCNGQLEIFLCDLKRDADTVQDLLLERQKISEWHCFPE